MANIMVAISGGVDSSVAAALLKEEGHNVIGVTMRIWDGEHTTDLGNHGYCYGPDDEDIDDAGRVSQALGIPFHVIDLTQEYKIEVLDYVRMEYLAGRTPNPCVRCNRNIKLDNLVKKARETGIEFEYVATGHYAHVEWDENNRRYLLKKARDITKDQSYFLFSLSQGQLSRCLFPLGKYTKKEVRKIALKLELGIDDKAESQDFIQGGYFSLVEASAKPGPIMDKQGNILGKHRGIPYYTVGQRKGLGISWGEALYVTAIDHERNAVVVGIKADVYEDKLICSGLNWIAINKLEQPTTVSAKIRYSSEANECVISPLVEEKAFVEFKEPQMAITPGQAIVFYRDDVVMGGGTIERIVR